MRKPLGNQAKEMLLKCFSIEYELKQKTHCAFEDTSEWLAQIIWSLTQEKLKKLRVVRSRLGVGSLQYLNLLGFVMDSSLTWIDHTQITSRKSSSTVFVIRRMRHIWGKRSCFTCILWPLSFGLQYWCYKCIPETKEDSKSFSGGIPIK